MQPRRSCKCQGASNPILEDELLNEEEFKIALSRTLESTRDSLKYSPPEEQDMHWEVLYEKLLAIFRSMNP